MIRPGMLVIAAALALLAAGCTTMQDSQHLTTISLEKPVHFSAPDGADVLAEPGRYHLDSFDGATLRLTPTESAAGTSPLSIAAIAFPHEEPIESRVALSVPNGEDEHHVVLLMPHRQGLDAAGSLAGTRARGVNIAVLSTAKLQAALALQPTIVGGYRGPTDFDIAYFHAPIHYQDMDSSNYRADYITRFDYDGNMIATDNWEHLTTFLLTAHAYYSVVETCTHWFIA